MLPPQVTLTYPKNLSVFFDAHYLIECVTLTLHLSAEELSNVRFVRKLAGGLPQLTSGACLVKFLLPTFLGVNPSEAALHKKVGKQVSLDDYEKHPLSYATQINLRGFDAYIRQYYASFVSAAGDVHAHTRARGLV